MTRGDWFGWAGCVLVGVGLALAPHFASLASYGTFEFLADNDDILYLAIARAPYHGEWSLRDPFASLEDRVPALHASGQFVPLAKLTAALGLGPLMMAAVWRGVGGILLATALYWLFRRLFSDIHRSGLATLCTLICLSDSGFVSGRPVIDGLRLVGPISAGMIPARLSQSLAQYRVVTPLTNLPFLIVLAGCLLPASFRPRWAIPAGAAALGACVWIYFFYWTAAVAAISGLIASWLVWIAVNRGDRGDAFREVRAAVLIGLGGLALGAPLIANNLRTSRDPKLQPVLQRLERGAHVPPGHLVRTQYLSNVWAWSELAVGAVAILWFRMFRLAPVWWLAAAGFALKNSATVTGLEFENFHWGGYVTCPFGEILILAIGVLLAERWGRGRAFSVGLTIVAVLLLGIATVWRPFEALRNPETARNAVVLDQLRPLRGRLIELTPADVVAGPDDTRVALLLGRAAQLYNSPYTAHSSLVPDDDVHQRAALNAWLMSISREEFAAALATDFGFQVGPIERPEWSREAVTTARLAWFDKLEASGGRPLLDRYHPNILLLPHGHSPPRPSGEWRLRQESGNWDLWERPL